MDVVIGVTCTGPPRESYYNNNYPGIVYYIKVEYWTGPETKGSELFGVSDEHADNWSEAFSVVSQRISWERYDEIVPHRVDKLESVSYDDMTATVVR